MLFSFMYLPTGIVLRHVYFDCSRWKQANAYILKTKAVIDWVLILECHVDVTLHIIQQVYQLYL